MAKADVITLCDLLGNNMGDDTVMGTLYDDIVNSWASLGILTVASRVALTASQATVNLPSAMLSVLSLIWDDIELGRMELRELEALDPGWRNRVGRPIAYTDETETARTLRLYPAPRYASDTYVPAHAEPLGRDYPAYSSVFIGAESRTDVPEQFELPLALSILEREFLRESNHCDPDFAKLCGQMAGTFLMMARGLLPQ